MSKLDELTRREFLRRSSALGLAGVAAPWALSLAAMGEAAAAALPGDYRALVCVFLYGGNDFANTLVPYDQASYNSYAAIRQALAIPRDQLTATALTSSSPLPGGRQMALNPALAPLKAIFDAGKMGVLLNIGTLVQPVTLAQYKAGTAKLPPKLFSHNDQQSVWQSSLPEGAVNGWGGRIGDLFLNANTSSTFTCINVSGNAVFMSGQQAVQYQISTAGALPLNALSKPAFGSAACSAALKTLITAPRSHLIEAEQNRVVSRALAAQGTLAGALSGVSLQTPFDAKSSLAMQLKMVAQLIAARSALGASRQVFFVSLGGFDLHDNLMSQHPLLLAQVASGLSSFYNAMVELGISDKVTSFTASDFGRTLSSNGDGSDHGWGGYHFVLGGAVKGGQYYGSLPAVSVGGPDDVGQGRLLPSTSVDQLAGTLASWMGVSDSSMPLVVPNIVNYSTRNLGFMA